MEGMTDKELITITIDSFTSLQRIKKLMQVLRIRSLSIKLGCWRPSCPH